MKKNIAIIMGGYSSEDKISIKSGEVVYKTLSEEKDINLYKVIIKKDEWYHEDKDFTKYEIKKDTFQIIKNNQLISIDLVFNTIHGIPGENGEIQSYLEKIGIHQTSSESYESKITFDKNICKEEIKKIGYLTPKSLIINKNEDYEIEEILSKLKLPIFIKPNAGGSSFGISRVDDKKNIINSINFCFKEDDNALIEEEISGREISVGVIKYKNEIISLPPMILPSQTTGWSERNSSLLTDPPSSLSTHSIRPLKSETSTTSPTNSKAILAAEGVGFQTTTISELSSSSIGALDW